MGMVYTTCIYSLSAVEDGDAIDPCILATLRKLQDGYFAGARLVSIYKTDSSFTIGVVKSLLHNSWLFCHHRVQMSDLSSFQTTSFHTRLSFLDEDTDDSLLEDDDDEDDDGEYGEEYTTCRPSGSL